MPPKDISKSHLLKSVPQPPRHCLKAGNCDRPCTCAMGNVSRFIEPVVLRILKDKQESYGYQIAECLPRYALTDATIEGAALYRTLRTLEANGHVVSTWQAGEGPARRNYALTPSGHVHLREWVFLLEGLGRAMLQFAHEAEDNSAAGQSDPAPAKGNLH